MERTKELNGAAVPIDQTDQSGRFYLVDPATGARLLVREMTDAQLASFLAGTKHFSEVKMKAVVTRLTLVAPALDANMLITMFEQAATHLALATVLDFEQNRRANAPAVGTVSS
jgi:hypothetical protein